MVSLATEPPQLHYAAGLFDGEGSITLTKRSDSRFCRLDVNLHSTDRGLVEFMADTFGGRIYDMGARTDRHKPIYQWRLTTKKAVEFLKVISPMLRESRKKRRAALVVGSLASLIRVGNTLSPADVAARRRIEREILAI